MRRALLAAALLLALPASASAAEDGVYEGEVTSGQGGTVTLTVTDGGTTVSAEFSGLGNLAGTCTGVGFSTGPVPLVDDSFNYSANGGQVTASGSIGRSSAGGAAQVLTNPCTTGSQAWRVVGPDMIVNKPEEIGLDVFDAKGAGQTISIKARRGETHSASLGAVNSGIEEDTFLVKGCDSGKGVKVSYDDDGENITSEVRAGTFETASLTPQAASQDQFSALMKVTKEAKVGKTFSCTVTADSGLLIDTVKVKLKVQKGKPRPD